MYILTETYKEETSTLEYQDDWNSDQMDRDVLESLDKLRYGMIDSFIFKFVPDNGAELECRGCEYQGRCENDPQKADYCPLRT